MVPIEIIRVCLGIEIAAVLFAIGMLVRFAAESLDRGEWLEVIWLVFCAGALVFVILITFAVLLGGFGNVSVC